MLYGRGSELEQVERLLADAREGAGRALMIAGEAGIGKTTMLTAAAESAPDVQLLAARGLEAEAQLPFSALTDLIRPLLDQLPTLPAPQRAALEGALALGPPVGGDRFAACAGFHTLICEAAREAPVLVAVDDAQWLDAASAQCIGFAGRRLQGNSIAILAASRTGEPSRFDATAFDRLELDRLAPDDARALLDAHHGGLPKTVGAAVLEAASGNPLAVIELPSELSAQQRSGEADVGSLIAPERIRSAFARRLTPLDQDSRLALAVAAAAGSRALGPIVAACRELELEQPALEAAESRGLITLSTEEIEFSHPLLRAVAYAEIAPAVRRRAHLALAASVGPEERGAPIAAADALERASALSTDLGDGARRLTSAGRAASAGGMHSHAAELLTAAAEIDHPTQRGEALHLLAMVSLYEAGNARTSYRLLADEGERLATSEPLHAAGVFADAAVAATTIGDCKLALATSERARELLGSDGDATRRAQVLSILGWSLTLCGEAARARELLAEVDRLLPDVDPFSPAAQSIALALNSRIPSEEYERAREECGAIVAGCREAGMLGMMPFPMAVEADACHRLGDWDGADERSAEAVALAEETGQRGPLSQALVIRIWLLAGRGDEAGARAAADRTLAIAEPADFGAITTFVLAGLGFLELSLARVDDAIETLERVAAIAAETGFDEPTLIPWAPDLVEAYAQAGRGEDAVRTASMLGAQAARAGGAFARAIAGRAEGLVADDFDDAFARALALHDERPAPFERARTALAYGTRLHRARRRVEARKRLREALAAFEQLEACPWAERARAELRAAGGVDRGPSADPDELTAQEIRVAHAVARGAKNREVAAELFLSPKTIEFHLGKIYRKLQIHSRTELAGLVAAGRLEPRVEAAEPRS